MNRLNIFYKTMLIEDKVNDRLAINDGAEGFEIHTENFKIDKTFDLSLLKKVVTIHAPFEDQMQYFSVMVNSHKSQDWKDLFKYASETNDGKGCGIVFHCDYTMDNIKDIDRDFIEFVKGTDNITFHIENSPARTLVERGLNGEQIIKDIPDVCNYLNDLVGELKFFPLLDTCHAFMDTQRTINKPFWTIEEYFVNYLSDNFVVHLSYAEGAGSPNSNHARTFDTNPVILDQILLLLKSFDKTINIVLEIFEDGYAYYGKPVCLNKMVEELQESSERTEVVLTGI